MQKQEQPGQPKGHEEITEKMALQFKTYPAQQLSPSFHQEDTISPKEIAKLGSVLTQLNEQEFHQSNKLGHVT